MKRLLATFLACLCGGLFSLSAFGLNDSHLVAPLQTLAVISFFYIGFRSVYRLMI
jgi:hypothetical protein